MVNGHHNQTGYITSEFRATVGPNELSGPANSTYCSSVFPTICTKLSKTTIIPSKLSRSFHDNSLHHPPELNGGDCPQSNVPLISPETTRWLSSRRSITEYSGGRDGLWSAVKPESERRWTNGGLMLAQRPRRWANINLPLDQPSKKVHLIIWVTISPTKNFIYKIIGLTS